MGVGLRSAPGQNFASGTAPTAVGPHSITAENLITFAVSLNFECEPVVCKPAVSGHMLTSKTVRAADAIKFRLCGNKSLPRHVAENGTDFDRVNDKRYSVSCENVPHHIEGNFEERFDKTSDRSKDSHDRGKNSRNHQIRPVEQEHD